MKMGFFCFWGWGGTVCAEMWAFFSYIDELKLSGQILQQVENEQAVTAITNDNK